VVTESIAEIPDGSTVVVDSAPIIYFLEGHARFASRFAPVFERTASGSLNIAISAITLAEVITGPLAAGNELLAERYRVSLTEASGWSVIPLSAALAVTAARFRVRYGLRLPDAVQLATTVETGAYALVTHDRDFRRVADVRVIS